MVYKYVQKVKKIKKISSIKKSTRVVCSYSTCRPCKLSVRCSQKNKKNLFNKKNIPGYVHNIKTHTFKKNFV